MTWPLTLNCLQIPSSSASNTILSCIELSFLLAPPAPALWRNMFVKPAGGLWSCKIAAHNQATTASQLCHPWSNRGQPGTSSASATPPLRVQTKCWYYLTIYSSNPCSCQVSASVQIAKTNNNWQHHWC